MHGQDCRWVRLGIVAAVRDDQGLYYSVHNAMFKRDEQIV